MNYFAKSDTLCMTTEKAQELFCQEELGQIKNNIGKRIIEAFEYKTHSEIASLMKTSCKTLTSNIEGQQIPPTEMLLCIHKLTGVSIHWLITGQGTKYISKYSSQLW